MGKIKSRGEMETKNYVRACGDDRRGSRSRSRGLAGSRWVGGDGDSCSQMMLSDGISLVDGRNKVAHEIYFQVRRSVPSVVS